MTFLQILFILASIGFIFISWDLRKRNKITLLVFIAIILGSIFVLIGAFNIEFINAFSQKVGIERGAELIVYCCIIFLWLAYLNLANDNQKDQAELSRLVSHLAIRETLEYLKTKKLPFKDTEEKQKYLLHVRVYNEATTLKESIEQVIQYGFTKFLFINDGSNDTSLELLEELQATHPECDIIICSHPINRGGGAANKTGFSFIKQHHQLLNIEYVITFDPDGQMDIWDMNAFLQAIKKDTKKNIDLFLGSRFVKGGSTDNMPFSRKIILQISRFVTRLFYGVKVSDPHCWYRIFRVEALKRIELTADGMHYANEINEQIKQKKLRYQEVPIHIKYTEYSLHKGQKNANSIRLGIEMIYKKFFFK